VLPIFFYLYFSLQLEPRLSTTLPYYSPFAPKYLLRSSHSLPLPTTVPVYSLHPNKHLPRNPIEVSFHLPSPLPATVPGGIVQYSTIWNLLRYHSPLKISSKLTISSLEAASLQNRARFTGPNQTSTQSSTKLFKARVSSKSLRLPPPPTLLVLPLSLYHAPPRTYNRPGGRGEKRERHIFFSISRHKDTLVQSLIFQRGEGGNQRAISINS